MIGQKRLLEKLNKYDELPKFIILEGSKGCGKKTLAKELANKYSLNYIEIGLKMEDILSMISIANNTTGNLFVIDKGNELSPNSENTLLKITEELPNDNHIILTCEMSILLLPTIISRGELFRFNDYTEEDFDEFFKQNPKLVKIENIKYSTIYSNFGYLLEYGDLNVMKLYDICQNLVTIDRSKLNIKFIFSNINKANDFNLDQFLYCLEKCCYEKILTAMKNKDRVSIWIEKDILNAITKMKKLLVESQVYNRKYIMDYLGLRIIEAYGLL